MSTVVLRYALFIVLAGLALLALSGSLLSASPVVIGLQLCALALGVWARRSFPDGSFRIGGSPAAGEVIRRGPYRWVRHPMYAAMLLFVWSGAAANATLWTASVRLLITGVIVLRVVLEEQVLRAHFEGYATYAASTKALVPFVM